MFILLEVVVLAFPTLNIQFFQHLLSYPRVAFFLCKTSFSIRIIDLVDVLTVTTLWITDSFEVLQAGEDSIKWVEDCSLCILPCLLRSRLDNAVYFKVKVFFTILRLFSLDKLPVPLFAKVVHFSIVGSLLLGVFYGLNSQNLRYRNWL